MIDTTHEHTQLAASSYWRLLQVLHSGTVSQLLILGAAQHNQSSTGSCPAQPLYSNKSCPAQPPSSAGAAPVQSLSSTGSCPVHCLRHKLPNIITVFYWELPSTTTGVYAFCQYLVVKIYMNRIPSKLNIGLIVRILLNSDTHTRFSNSPGLLSTKP